MRRARDSVLVNISHEFRTPLAAQLASIELLREGFDTMTTDQQKELVLSLERGALRLTRLIDNLLESVRIESGQLSIRHQSVAIAEVVEDSDALVGALLTQRRQRLEVDLPEELAECGWRRSASDAGVRQLAGQREQVRARGQRDPDRRGADR